MTRRFLSQFSRIHVRVAQVANHPYFRTNYLAGFVQDDWKARPNLTVNLGLRYEYYSPLREKFDRLSNLFLGSQGLTNAQVRPVDKFL